MVSVRTLFSKALQCFSPLRARYNKQSPPEIIVRFLAVSRRYSEKSAIEYAGQKLTYAELCYEVQQISKRLQTLEVKGSVRIALLFENRLHAVAAMLGVLKSGHAFVMLDSADPETRIRTILNDSAPIALLTDTENYHRSEALYHDGLVVDIQTPLKGMQPRKKKKKNPGKMLSSETSLPNIPDMAYLFYTSGSTGEPKGVCQTRQNLQFFIDTYAQNLNITSDDRLSLLYSLSFSAAVMDIFGALLNGATLCAYDMRREGIPGLERWLEDEKISVLHTVPTVFRKLALGLHAGKILDKVRAIDLGGEAVTGKDVELFRDHFNPSCRLVNRLAATEICVIAQYPVTSADEQQSVLPVGFSPTEVQISIQGPDGSSVSSGECGRIIISSPYLCPGYWRRPELNKQVFRSDLARPGWRIFQTGDRGYLDENGMLYFQGRDGTRVKIRGHSIDLAEVESAFRFCEGVRDVAVVTANRDQNPEADLLVAHIVMEAPVSGNPVQMRRSLASYIPSYMIPTVFQFTSSLPLTVSGKVDRRALQEIPLPDFIPQSDPLLLPANDLEREVAQLFKDLLHREEILRNDDFFLAGGDSLSAVELQIRLSGILNKKFPLSALMTDSTVIGIVNLMERLRNSEVINSPSPLLVPLREKGEGPVLFLVHGRLGQAPVSPRFLSLFEDRQAVYALQARGLEPGDPPHQTLDAMARDYIAAIRMVQPKGPYLISGLCAGGHIAVVMASLLRAEGETVLPLLLIDPPPPPFERSQEHSTREELVYIKKRRLQKKFAQQSFDSNLEKQRHIQAALDTALAFEEALSNYRPVAYAYPVNLIASSKRCGRRGWGDTLKRENFFSGPLKIFEVGKAHSEVFDVNNVQFVKAISDCMREIGKNS